MTGWRICFKLHSNKNVQGYNELWPAPAALSAAWLTCKHMCEIWWFQFCGLDEDYSSSRSPNKGRLKKKQISAHSNSSVVLMVMTWFSAIQEVSLVYLSLKRTQCAMQFNYRAHWQGSTRLWFNYYESRHVMQMSRLKKQLFVYHFPFAVR